MDMFICNRCFATVSRGKKPFCLTQCGHVYCKGCIPQAEKQCPQCQQMDIFSVQLQQPSLAKVENFFIPLNESLELLHKVYGFQSNQMKIVMHRFHDIDKKYETLKSHCYNLTRNLKVLQDKYVKLQMDYTQLQEKLMSMKMHSSSLNSLSNISTPINSTNKRISRNMSNSCFTSSGVGMSCEFSNTEKERKILRGLHIPPSVSSNGFRGTSNATYTFKP
ncbi:uncharacterized protein LOC143177292 [Calliopsis andreniformis]|uniref:uncharacterized protein LOC143177292 n=1 Tax=Calliopsis andreniformis TaxID=337506 RepID=UPI003FCCEA8F